MISKVSSNYSCSANKCTKNAPVDRKGFSKGSHGSGLGSGLLSALSVIDSLCVVPFLLLASVSHLGFQELRLKALLEPRALKLAV